MSDQPTPERPRSRSRDFWTLHVPLVVVLVICVSATIIEGRRAFDDNWRALVYTVEWPLIGVFAVVVWNRYRRHGSLSQRFRSSWERKIAAYADEDARAEAAERARAEQEAERATPEARAWQAHLEQLRRDEPGPDLR